MDTKNECIDIVKRVYLKDLNWDERKLQKLLFENLDRVIREEELLVIMQSRRWQEEPDLMAIDEKGSLYIFELKAWETQSSNVLQVLRYGQIFGQYDYEQLNNLFSNFSRETLIEAHRKRFPDANICEGDFNKKQHYIVLTNGIDIKTREAILYWKKQGLEIKGWIYRIYQTTSGEIYLEFNTYKTVDDPFEDIEEGYYIVNTNYSNNPLCHKDMLENKKAAAYYHPWKNHVKRLQRGDYVFLYQSGIGIVARGTVKSDLKKSHYPGKPKDIDEEYYVELKSFSEIKKPLTATEIKTITSIDYRFMMTCFSVDRESGNKIWNELTKRI
ncbi:EVE domain-containing protein [Candidatus Methanoperedens nitratireducens]|uniref:EVE domain-containing protein n=1 Tax=Candidatus Methanoperedens nitratireducens TaxID=1392998 RepID=UPI0012FF3078|nr:EVE domain-containing protein [Candidatus Methanoperedens nitroreducens]